MRLAAAFLAVACAAGAQTRGTAPPKPAPKPPAAGVRLVAQSISRTQTAPAPQTRITRAAVETLERATDRKFETTMDEDPFSLLGSTRGVYLDKFGVVFTTELDLAPSAAPNPFRPAYGRGELQLLREKKKYRIGQLKESMRAMLYTFATSLEGLRTDEYIAIAVTIPYFRWEMSEGLPRQIVMAGTRKSVLDARAGNLAAAAALKVEEVF